MRASSLLRLWIGKEGTHRRWAGPEGEGQAEEGGARGARLGGRGGAGPPRGGARRGGTCAAAGAGSSALPAICALTPSRPSSLPAEPLDSGGGSLRTTGSRTRRRTCAGRGAPLRNDAGRGGRDDPQVEPRPLALPRLLRPVPRLRGPRPCPSSFPVSQPGSLATPGLRGAQLPAPAPSGRLRRRGRRRVQAARGRGRAPPRRTLRDFVPSGRGRLVAVLFEAVEEMFLTDLWSGEGTVRIAFPVDWGVLCYRTSVS